MEIVKRKNSIAKCLVLLFVVLSIAECGRTSSGRSSSRSSYSRPSYSRPSPSYSHPSPSYSHPSPSYSRPSPSYSHPSPSYSHPSPSYSRPSYSPPPSYSRPSPSSHPSPSPASRPIGFENVKPVSSSNTGSHSGTSGSHTAPVGPPNYGFSSTGTHGSGSSAGNHGSNPPSYGFNPSVTHGAGSQSHASNPSSQNIKPSAPLQEHVANSKHVGTVNTAAGHAGTSGANPPPYGFKPATNTGQTGTSGANPPPYGFKPSAPVGPPTNVKPVGNTPPGAPYPVQPPPYTPHNPGIPPPAYNPAHNPAGYGAPPAYSPSYNPAGYGHAPAYNPGYGHTGGYGHPSQQHYTGSPGGVTNIHINNINTNNNNHHYGGGGLYSGGYNTYGSGLGGCHFNCYPSYHYSSGDVGSGTLGFFLGYSLAKVTTPTYYSHTSFYNGYTPRYDHYEVHHYYHNRDSVPAQSTIQANTIVGCIGDSGTICPTGTTSLCTSNGAILCVASATTTVPCSDQKQGNCVKTTIPCINGTGNCEIGTNKTVTIPCISQAKVPGNITYVNNTIIVNNMSVINNNYNGTTNGTIVSTNSTTVASESNVQNGTVSPMFAMDSALAALNNVTGNSSSIGTTLPSNITTDGTRAKRETPSVPINEFCVTILALPAERKPTEQETVFSKGTSIFSKFLVKALGAN